ncbi:MAG TPA: phosphoribosylformylglycinamidine synthase subunit PurS, partial [Thermodesulfobacteriota bacterium]|nr:phosphoribosylformylglycinamidine synthase subunit PurS [Thermodesulfobacteriota bacterium]
MVAKIEIALKPELFDAEGAAVKAQAQDYFGIKIDSVRMINIITLDAEFTAAQLEEIRTKIFTNPVIHISGFDLLDIEFDWAVWVGFRPGVRDTAASTAREAIEDLLKIGFKGEEACYTSKLFCIRGKGLDERKIDLIARESLANDLIQQWKIFEKGNQEARRNIGLIVP